MPTPRSPVTTMNVEENDRKRSRVDDDDKNLDVNESMKVRIIDDSTTVSNDTLYQVVMNNNRLLDELKDMIVYLIDENAKCRSEIETMRTTYDDALDQLQELKQKQIDVAPTNVDILTGMKEVQRSIENLNCGSAPESVSTKPSGATYAAVTKTSSKVIIKPKTSSQSSIQTKSAISDAVNPSKFPILSVREIKNGGLIVECRDKSEVDNFKSDVEKKMGNNYEVTTPSGRTPKVRIIGMTNELTADKVTEQLLAQNEAIFSVGNFKVVQLFKAKKSFGAKLEVDGEIFKRISEAGRVLIGWDSCIVHEALDVLRCYNCLGFHHTAKNCKSAKACIKCGLEHESKNCQATTESCINCVKTAKARNLNINVGHNALSNSCMVYQRKLTEDRTRVDYEFVKQQ